MNTNSNTNTSRSCCSCCCRCCCFLYLGNVCLELMIYIVLPPTQSVWGGCVVFFFSKTIVAVVRRHPEYHLNAAILIQIVVAFGCGRI